MNTSNKNYYVHITREGNKSDTDRQDVPLAQSQRFSINWFFYIIFALFISLCLFEGLVVTLHQLDLRGYLNTPIKKYYLKYFRHAYLRDRNIVQYQTECARYDEFLFYTLRPGICNFQNDEFNVRMYNNSLGFRDDEKSLENPQVIFLGDSYTMGWGVNQEEAFPQIFEKITNLKTLNAGISSYGTVRELMATKKLISEKTQYIFIQYTKNDIYENKKFYDAGFLKISSKEKYHSAIKTHESYKKYTPGEHANLLLYLLWLKFRPILGGNVYYLELGNYLRPSAGYYKVKHSLVSKNNITVDPDIETKYFINALEKFKLHLMGPEIIVFSINDYNKNNPKFIKDLSRLTKGTSLEKKLHPLDISHVLNEGDYFSIDGHINRRGHQKLAIFLSKFFRA
jgi:hypothetical protein